MLQKLYKVSSKLNAAGNQVRDLQDKIIFDLKRSVREIAAFLETAASITQHQS